MPVVWGRCILAPWLRYSLSHGQGEYQIPMPKVVQVELTGALPTGVMAMDVILKMLSIFGVKGGKGKVFEYCGAGAASLSVTERATITNMGAEMGASTSIFSSDERTKDYLEKRGRGGDYQPLAAEAGADMQSG